MSKLRWGGLRFTLATAAIALAAPAFGATVIGAKTIRITSAVGQALQIAELQAFDYGNVNMALATNGGTVIASASNSSAPASKAIDGIAPGVFPNMYVSSAGTGAEFLSVTLAAPTDLSKLTLFGRSGSVPNSSTRDFYNVSILNDVGATIFSGQLDNRALAGAANSFTFDTYTPEPEPPVTDVIKTTEVRDAAQLGNVLQGGGMAFTSAILGGTADTGVFSDGMATGFSNGVVLTTGSLSCAGASNTKTDCSGTLDTSGSEAIASSLALEFTATDTSMFLDYVLASEEYNEFVGESFVDTFSIRLDGQNYADVNIAKLANGTDASINTINLGSNRNLFRNNDGSPGSLNLPLEYDGLTRVLTASANNLVIGANYRLTFQISDTDDSLYDSALFIKGGSIRTTLAPSAAVPEPATWAMMISGFGLMATGLRRRRRGVRVAA